jgi:hypothetical protein
MPGTEEPSASNLYACKPQACALQECIAANDYQEKRCLAAIAALIACCDAQPPGTAAAPLQCAFNPRYRDWLAAEKARQQ